MQLPKIIYFLLISLLILVLSFDTYVYFSSIANFRSALCLALDDGLIAGVIEGDSQHGRLMIDDSEGYRCARTSLKDNLKLDDTLTNAYYSDSEFVFDLRLVNGYPVAHGQFKTHIHLLCLKLVGKEAIPYGISKNQEYLNRYI